MMRRWTASKDDEKVYGKRQRLRRSTTRRRTCRELKTTMTSDNVEEADVRGVSEEVGNLMGTRRRMSSYNQEEKDEWL